jgi:hypothetical protein
MVVKMQVWSGLLDWQAVDGQGRGGESGVYTSGEVFANVNLLYYVSTVIYIWVIFYMNFYLIWRSFYSKVV